MNLFNPDSKFFQLLHLLGELMILNFVYMVCCLPIVTIGPATAAMYTVTLQEAEDKGGSFLGRFFRAFKDNFLKSMGIGLILLLIGGILVYNYIFLYANPTLDAGVFRGLLIAMSVVYVMITSYAYPLQARYENTVMRTMRNALALAIGNLPKTIVMMFLNLFPLLLLILSEALFLSLVIVLLLIYFALAAQLNSLMLIKIFKKVDEQNKTSGNGAF